MSLTHNYQESKADGPGFKSVEMGSGNVVPGWWYHKVLSCGKPDLVAITILSELWFLHRNNGGAEFNNGYIYFEKKFNLTRAQLQDATLRLHEAGLVTRTFRTVVVQGRKFPNELHLLLNTGKILALKPASKGSSSGSGNNSGSNGSSFASGDNGNSSSEEEGGVFCNHVFGNSDSGSFENSRYNLIDKNREYLVKNRSTDLANSQVENSKSKSGFCKNSFNFGEGVGSSLSNHNQSSLGVNRVTGAFTKGLELKDFYPLTPEDCDFLQKASRRAFSLHAMNEILRDMSCRLSERIFKSKKAFLSYMAKVFANEIRDAVKISNQNFRIRSKGSEEDRIFAREAFLSKIENSTGVSPEDHFRKKLAAMLAPEKAFELLKSCKTSKFEGGVLILELGKDVELTTSERGIILRAAQGVYNMIDLTKSFAQGVGKLEIKVLEPNRHKTAPINPEEYIPVFPANVWGQVARALLEHYGQVTYRNWFGRLEEVIDDEAKTITLKTPSSFVKAWLESNYLHTIRLVAKEFGFVVGISFGNERIDYNELTKKEYKPNLPNNVWGQIRKTLLARGGFWEFEDKLRLSRLGTCIDEQNKAIKLVLCKELDTKLVMESCFEGVREVAASIGFKVSLSDDSGRALA